MSTEELKDLPAVADAISAVDVLSNMVANYSITDDAGYREAAEDLKRIKAAAKKLEEARDGQVRPLNEQVRAINGFFSAPSQQLQNAEKTIKRAIAAYADEQDRTRREAQRKLDEAAAKERARLAAQEAKAIAAGKVEKAEQIAERAAMVVAPVAVTETPRVAGVQMREAWKFVIEDPTHVPREMCTPDEKKIGAIVRALKGDAKIPGVRVYAERVVAAGAA